MTGRFRSTLCSGAMLLAFGSVGALAQSAAPAPNGAVATPRTPDGHPDLNGVFGNGGGNAKIFDPETDTGSNNVPARNGRMANFEDDGGLGRMSNRNRPQYKPEFWQKIRDLDWTGNKDDPEAHCRPEGVPRVGPPKQIIASKDRMVFIPPSGAAAGNPGPARVFFTDGRPHDPAKVAQETWNGDSQAHWEGDTLVIDTIGFTDASWLEKSAYIHGYQLKVTERLTRTGNDLLYQVTVEDPEYLTQPWVMNPRRLRYDTDPNATVDEQWPCDERDVNDMVGHNRGGGGRTDPGPTHLFGMVVPPYKVTTK